MMNVNEGLNSRSDNARYFEEMNLHYVKTGARATRVIACCQESFKVPVFPEFIRVDSFEKKKN